MRLRTIWILLALAFLGLAPPVRASAGPPPEVALLSRETSAGRVYFVRIPPSLVQTALEVHLAAGGRGDAETFASFVHRLRPAMAVNGTYFSYSDQRGFTLVMPLFGDGLSEAGETERPGLRGSVLAVRSTGEILLRRLETLREARSLFESGEYRVVLGAGPTLVRGNRPLTSVSDWVQEGFSATGGVLDSGDRPRVGAGISPAGELILASSVESVPLDRWARALNELGCVDAVNLDGGKSQGFFVQPEGLLQAPTDPLTNVITVADLAARGRPKPDSDLLMQAARAAEAGGDLAVAEERFREVVYQYPESVEGNLGAAEVLEKQGRKAAAAAFYAQAGLLEAARGRSAASRRCLSRALVLSPGRVDVATALSGLQGLEEEEVAVLEECLAWGLAQALRQAGWGDLPAPLARQARAAAPSWQGRPFPLPAGFQTLFRSGDGGLVAVDARRAAALTLVAAGGAAETRRLFVSGVELSALRRPVAPGVSAVLLLPVRREREGWSILEGLARP